MGQSLPRIHLQEWGRSAWHMLHTMTFVYPLDPSGDEQNDTKDFFEKTLPKILPCKVCSYHYKELIAKYPIQNKNRETLSRWLVDIHNQVNLSLKKPVMSFEKVCELYLPKNGNTKIAEKTGTKFETCLWVVLFLLLLSLVSMWFCFR
jgi:hypothetical protein